MLTYLGMRSYAVCLKHTFKWLRESAHERGVSANAGKCELLVNLGEWYTVWAVLLFFLIHLKIFKKQIHK